MVLGRYFIFDHFDLQGNDSPSLLYGDMGFWQVQFVGLSVLRPGYSVRVEARTESGVPASLLGSLLKDLHLLIWIRTGSRHLVCKRHSIGVPIRIMSDLHQQDIFVLGPFSHWGAI